MVQSVLYKFLVVGDVGVGKTTIVKRNVKDIFSNTKPTIGVDFVLKEVKDVVPGVLIRLQLWDVAGQERYKSLTRVYYKEAAAAIVVFDCTQHSTLEGVEEWKRDIDEKVTLPDGRPIPCILLGNKADLDSSCVSEKKLKAFADKNGFVGSFFTSAKTGLNIRESMDWLVSHVYNSSKAAKGAKAVKADAAPLKTVTLEDKSPRAAMKTYKLVLMSGATCGKRSIASRLANDSFSTVQKLSNDALGIAIKQIETRQGPVKVELWVIPSKPKANLAKVYFKDVHGAFFIYDAANFASLQEFVTLRATLLEHTEGKLPPCVVLANKVDLPTARLLAPKEVSELLAEHAFVHYFDTSAVTGQNLNSAVEYICQNISDTNPRAGLQPSSPVKAPVKKKGGCCK
eukprot:TRINITY_DN11851_c0_g1_i1.p1 TRINITY_DN11851_c0_g1~~TRINITY_DN11851_c0_g1_i1.p1  ORF type:complete len:399 (+),score=204.83 TRINITY_DN11851_c0_g1_i1:386-1582(+)